jgi:hypothetical protein
MLGLFVEHLCPDWGGMGVKVWVLLRGLGGPGHTVIGFYYADALGGRGVT